MISVGSPARVTVRCGWGRLLVGLSATRHTTGSPLLIPPSMPPWRLSAPPAPSGAPAVVPPGIAAWGVRPRADPARSLRNKGTVMGAATGRAHAEAGAIPEGCHRWQRQEPLGQVGLELVEDRLA